MMTWRRKHTLVGCVLKLIVVYFACDFLPFSVIFYSWIAFIIPSILPTNCEHECGGCEGIFVWSMLMILQCSPRKSYECDNVFFCSQTLHALFRIQFVECCLLFSSFDAVKDYICTMTQWMWGLQWNALIDCCCSGFSHLVEWTPLL